MQFPYTPVIELICLGFALFFISNKRSGYFVYIKWLMLLIVIVEFASFFLHEIYKQRNGWLYNLFVLPAEIICICIALNSICENYFKARKLSILMFLALVLCYVTEGVINGFFKYSHYTNSVFSVYIIFMCCLYYYYLLKSDEVVDIAHESTFWIISGLFFFYFGSTACNLFHKQLEEISQQKNIPLRRIIFIVLNFLLYSCWSYAFVCLKRLRVSHL